MHWAKGLLSPHIKDFVIAAEYCGDKIDKIEDRERIVVEKLSRPIKVFPNPASELLTIQNHGKEKLVKFEITNLSGKTFDMGFLSDFTKQIDISTYPLGVYILNYSNEHISSAVKFIKID